MRCFGCKDRTLSMTFHDFVKALPFNAGLVVITADICYIYIGEVGFYLMESVRSTYEQ